MTRIWKGKRILSLALALILLMTSVNLPAPIFAANEEQTASDTTEQTNPMVGCKVKLAEASGLVYAYPDPSNASQYTLTGSYAFPKVMVIKSVYESGSKTYYQIFAAEGYSWPENSNVTEGYYLESTKVTILEPCDKCGKIECGSSHENWCEICKVDNCTNDHISATVTDIQGNPVVGSDGEPLKVTVAGDLPDGATVESQDFSSVADANTDVGIFNISVNHGGSKWQPKQGEYVTVTIPAPVGATTVHVLHFLEDVDRINNALENEQAEILECGDIPAEYVHIFDSAIKAYQEAFNSSDICVVYELFMDVPVIGGAVTVQSQGFSMFSSVNAETDPLRYTINDTDIGVLDNSYGTVYVRPGDWIRLTSSGSWLITSFYFGTLFNQVDPPEYVTVLDRKAGWFVQDNSYYLKIEDNAKTGSSFTVGYYAKLRTYSLKVQVIDYFEFDKVRISVYTKDGYPVELSEFNPAAGYVYYKKNEATAATPGSIFRPEDGNLPTDIDCVFTYTPSELIKVNELKASNKYLTNSEQTVYGMVDTTGVSTTAFLTDQFINEIAPDLLADCCAANGVDPDSYHLVVYTIKYEAIGDNVGWYINCKIAPNDSYLLEYDYNFPTGFDQFDIDSGSEVKPGDKTVETKGAESVVEKIGHFSTITLTTKAVNPLDGQEQTRKAKLTGWATSSTATEAEYKVGSTEYNLTMEGNTTLYAVWEITEGNWEYSTFDWTIHNALVNGQNKPVTGDVEFTYYIGIDGESNFSMTYKVYDSAGNSVYADYQYFTPVDGGYVAFTIKGNEYIIIDDVPIKGTEYHIYTVEQIGEASGYELQTQKVTISLGNTNIPTTGNTSTTIVNEQLVYSIDYDTDGGIVPDNTTDYTVEDMITLVNPTKEGHTFAGWIGTDLTEPTLVVTIPTGSIGERSYTATWTVNQYKIHYDTEGGSLPEGVQNPSEYDYGTVITQLPAPKKEGFAFKGWSYNGDTVTDEQGYIRLPGNVTEYMMGAADIYLVAQWEQANTTLTISVTGINTSLDPDQTVLLNITGNGVDLTVAVCGNSAVTIDGLTIGKTYTVTLKNSWSWRYGGEVSKTVTIAAGGSTVEFEVSRDKDKWLDGNDYWPNSDDQKQN